MKIIILIWDDSKVVERSVFTTFENANTYTDRLNDCGIEYDIDILA